MHVFTLLTILLLGIVCNGLVIFIPDCALDFIRKEIRQNSIEAQKFSSAKAALAALRREN